MSSNSSQRKYSINKIDYKPKRLGLIYSPSTIGFIIVFI